MWDAAQFTKKKPPQRYRYDSSLSPGLDWDGQNTAREEGEALPCAIMDATTLNEAKAANADGRYGHWQYHMIKIPAEVRETLDACAGPVMAG